MGEEEGVSIAQTKPEEGSSPNEIPQSEGGDGINIFSRLVHLLLESLEGPSIQVRKLGQFLYALEAPLFLTIGNDTLYLAEPSQAMASLNDIGDYQK